ncbi:MAG: hypothetical protein OEY49_06855 [Candidatus Heimdallarchaeota archaeon]|nr:hypothetical protein [Candidatus Heimdallarchaeota archaeon]
MILFNFIINYFFYNKQRSFRGIIILSIGLVLIFSSNIMLSGLIYEIDSFSSLIQRSNTRYQIVSEEGDFLLIDQNAVAQINELFYFTEQLRKYTFDYIVPVDLSFNQTYYGSLKLRITNLSIIQVLGEIVIDQLDSNTVYFESRLGITLEVQSQFELNWMNFLIVSNQSDYFSEALIQNYDILIDANSPNIPHNLVNRWNRIEFEFLENEDKNILLNDLKQIPGIIVRESRGDKQFLEVSTNQFVKIIVILQLFMSILLIFSISSIMLSIINENEKDIVIMRSLGFSNMQIKLIYIGQSILIGLTSVILSVVLSILILYGLFALIASTGLLPFLNLVIELDIVLINLIQTLIVCTISGIYAVSKVIFY